MEVVYGQMLALWLGDGNEHRALESDTTGLNVKGNLNLYLTVNLEEVLQHSPDDTGTAGKHQQWQRRRRY